MGYSLGSAAPQGACRGNISYTHALRQQRSEDMVRRAEAGIRSGDWGVAKW